MILMRLQFDKSLFDFANPMVWNCRQGRPGLFVMTTDHEGWLLFSSDSLSNYDRIKAKKNKP